MQREQAEMDNAGAGPVRPEAAQLLPAALRRRYRVYFKPETKRDVMRLREVRADAIGKLVTVKVCTNFPPQFLLGDPPRCCPASLTNAFPACMRRAS